MNLDDLLKSIREEDDDSKGGKDLDDLLKSIRSEKQTQRKTFENKLGKDVVSKLSDSQIKKLSEYYNSLPPKEKQKTDKEIAKKRGEFFDIARGMAGIKFVELNENEKQKFTPNAAGVEQGPMLPPEKEGGDVYSPRKNLDVGKFLKRKTFENPLKGQRFTAPEIIQTRSTKSRVKSDKILPKDGVIGEEIEEKLDELIKVIREDNKLEEKSQKLENKENEKDKKKKREDRIENKKQNKIFVLNLKKSTEEVGGFFNNLKRFLKFALLGGVINTLYNFIMDPKNAEKVKAVQGFLKDWWPALALAIGAILTPFKGLFLRTVGFLASTTFRIINLLRTNPLFSLAVAFGAEAVRDYLLGEKRKAKLRKEVMELMEKEGISETEARKKLRKQKEEEKEEIGFTANPFDRRIRELRMEIDQLQNVDYERSKFGFNLSGDAVNRAPGFEKELTTDQELFINPGTGAGQVPSMKAFSGGAMVTSSSGSTGMSMGTDKVHSLLTPGEIVFSRPSVSYWGADTLLAMNKMGGGTNRPKVGKVMGYQGGGFVISPEERRMLDAISGAEGTKGYGTLFGGRNIPELAKGEMTINQVLTMQETGLYKGMSVYAGGKYASAATGRYQFMPDVLREEANRYGYDLDKTKFTPQLQDELILRRIRRMRGVTPEMLKSEGMSDRIIDMLAPEFASFPNLFGPDNEGRYGTNSSYYGQGGKSAEYIRGLYNKSDGKGEMKFSPLPNIPNSPTMRGSLGPAFDSDSNIKKQQSITNNFNNIRQKLSNPLESFVFTPLRRALSVGTPNVPTETRNFMMPPVETPKQNQSSNQTGDIPAFNVSSGNSMRDLVAKDLGIHDLVGAS